MKELGPEIVARIAILATEAEKHEPFSEKRSQFLREIGKIWEEQGYPQIAEAWYASANLKPND